MGVSAGAHSFRARGTPAFRARRRHAAAPAPPPPPPQVAHTSCAFKSAISAQLSGTSTACVSYPTSESNRKDGQFAIIPLNRNLKVPCGWPRNVISGPTARAGARSRVTRRRPRRPDSAGPRPSRCAPSGAGLANPGHRAVPFAPRHPGPRAHPGQDCREDVQLARHAPGRRLLRIDRGPRGRTGRRTCPTEMASPFAWCARPGSRDGKPGCGAPGPSTPDRHHRPAGLDERAR